MLHKIYATIHTELEIRNVNRAKYFRKSHIKKEGRIEEVKKGREERKEGGWDKNILVRYSNYKK